MKNYQLIIAGIAVLAIASCKKNDDLTVQQAQAKQAAATATTATSSSLSAWQANREISDEKITEDVVQNGLVLVFMKTATGAEQLPFSQKGVNWYYQVSNGSISVESSAAAGTTVNNDVQLRYVVLSKEQLDALGTKGETKASLVNIDYLKALSLFK